MTSGLENLTAAVSAELPVPQAEVLLDGPAVPETIEETGLAAGVIEQLLLRIMYFRGEVVGRDLASAVGLKFSLIEAFLDYFKQHHYVQVRRSLGIGSISSAFALSEAGRSIARGYLEANQYIGPAPVPLAQYACWVKRQRRQPGWLTRELLQKAYAGIVVTPRILSQIGPAISSGNSFLIYGQPGNGKTYLAEALAQIDDSPIYAPYAIECNGAIIQIYDPVYHNQIETAEPPSVLTLNPLFDGRWFRCRRPFIMTGGELTLDMLDLSYNENAKTYDAPFQLKANNGIYLIDDFGRSRATPAEVLNRWIVPMERRVDFLSLKTGGKLTVPFEAFLVFSTNLKPHQLGDEAFLRRIQYKMLLRNPTEEEFTRIFEKFCHSKNLPFEPDLPRKMLEKHYRAGAKQLRRCHPRDVLLHAINLIHFEALPMELTEEVLDRAFESCFVQDEE